jgi:hypothetical protein
MFNTLKYAKHLEAAGVSRNQAEAHVQIIAEIVEGDLATKQDIQELRSELRQDIQGLKIELTSEMAKLEHKLVIKLGGLATVLTGLLLAAIKIT